MKKITLELFIAIIISNISVGQAFHQLSLKNIDGINISLGDLAGKKTLVYVLPLNGEDSAFSQLQAFKSRYLDTVNIIGVLSFEDGYQSENAAAIKTLYNQMGITLSEGIYTRKTSGNNQSSFMRWLTDKNKNMHFDMDTQGRGHKFFISGSGKLYAVIPPQLLLSAAIIDKIVHSSTR